MSTNWLIEKQLLVQHCIFFVFILSFFMFNFDTLYGGIEAVSYWGYFQQT